MISILCAVDHEAALIRKALSNADSFRFSHLTCVVGAYARQEISLGIIGMGGASAGLQTSVFLNYFRPRFIILAGYAGSLVDVLSKGEVALAQNYARLSDLKLPKGLKSERLVSVDQVVASRSEREILNQRSQAAMVDMETASVAAEVARHQIPFLPLRAISDGLQDELPTQALASAYSMERQRPTIFRLVTHLFANPQEIGPFARFVSGLSVVRRNLTEMVLETIRLNAQTGL